MSEPIGDIPAEPVLPSGTGYSFPSEVGEQPTPEQPGDGTWPVPVQPVFPAWTFREVAVVLCLTVFVLVACSIAAVGFAHKLPAYRHVPIVELASSPLLIIGAQTVAYAIVLAFMMMLLRGHTTEPFFVAIRWSWPHRALKFFLLGIVLSFAVEGLSNLFPVPKSLPIDKFFNSPSAAYVMAIFGLTLAPLLEEIFFRGLLYPVLRKGMGVWLGVVATGAAFAAIHGAQLGYAWAPILGIFVVGVVLTVVRQRADSVGASFLTHCGYNFTLFFLLWISSDHFRHLEKITN